MRSLAARHASLPVKNPTRGDSDPVNEIVYRRPEKFYALQQQHIDSLTLEVRSLERQVKKQDEFIKWQAQRIVELETAYGSC
jgi:hypothetical protein